MEIDPLNLAKWLGITEQQNQVLQTIYTLEAAKTDTSPQNILKEYTRLYGKNIQVNNLFTIIKTLADEGLITKKEKARYSINVEGIRERLTEASNEQRKDLDKINTLTKNLHEYYKSAVKDQRPTTTFFDSREIWEKSADALKTASTYYVTSRLPNITFSRPIAHRLWQDRYVDTLHQRCFVKKDLKIVYLTQLTTDHLYRHALDIFGKPELAAKEVEMALDNLWTYIISQDNFEAHYLPNPIGLYMSIIEKQGEPSETFIFLQSEENVNGIYIKSHEMARQAKESFQTGLKTAIPLVGSKGEGLINDAKAQLREKRRK